MRTRVNGIELAYDDVGPRDAEVVVLHHTLATSRAMWQGIVEALAGRYRAVTLDARGHGASEAPQGAYDFATLAGDVTGLMDALGIQRAHYLGSSMGGMVGQQLGLLAPDRIASLTLVSTTSRVPEAARANWDERLAAVRAAGMESQVASTIERWFTKPFIASGDPILAAIEDMIRTTPPAGFLGWGMAIRGLDLTDRLPEIDRPTLVVVGREDPSTPVEAAKVIHGGIPGSRLVVIDNASHQLPLERPEPFLRAVTDFLESV